MDRVSTGVDGLDTILQGGFPRGTTTLLLGKSGTGKSTWVKQFIGAGLKKDEHILIVLSSQSIPDFLKSLNHFDAAPNKHLNQITFIDLYSWRSPFSDDKPKQLKYEIVGPEDLNDLNKILTDCLSSIQNKNCRIIIDSISDILLFESSKSVFKLMQLFVAKLHHNKGIALVAIEEGMHRPEDVSTLNYIFDNLIEMKLEDGKRYLKICKMFSTSHPLDWLEYDLDQGILLKTTPPFK